MAYPYLAWVLQPSFKPVQVEIVADYSGEWVKSSKGKPYHKGYLFPTKEAAIADGWKRLGAQEADLQLKLDNIAKRKAALTKATA